LFTTIMTGDTGFIDQLDDDALYTEVRKYKPDAGPVVDSTRSLYRRILRKSLDGGITLTPDRNSSAGPSDQVPETREDEFEVLEELPAEDAEPAVPVSSNTRASRGRTSTATASPNQTASPIPELRKRHSRQVSFDDNVEWVQNDPEEEAPVTISFFLKAVLIGAFLCLIVTLFIVHWTYTIAAEEQLMSTADPSISSGSDSVTESPLNQQ
jgi:hypothetical protein